MAHYNWRQTMNDHAKTAEREIPVQTVDTNMASLITRQELDVQIATAQKYPRSIKTFQASSLELATLNEQTAQQCIYALPRDGKTIEGPSARFGEIMIYAWRNCRAGARIVDESGEFVTAQGVFMDLQQNTGIAYEVQRRIVDKNGRRYKPDMIGVTANAAASIALRNAALKGIPKALWEPVYQAARRVVMGDFKTLANRREEAIKLFIAYGVTPEMMCGVLGVKGKEDIGLEQLVVLKGILTAIQEGDTTVEQAFSADAAGKPPVEGPKARSAPPPPPPPARASAPEREPGEDTGEEKTGGATTTNKPPIGGNKAEPKLISKGAVNILASKMKQSGWTNTDLKARYGFEAPDQITTDRYNAVIDWAAKPAAH